MDSDGKIPMCPWRPWRPSLDMTHSVLSKRFSFSARHYDFQVFLFEFTLCLAGIVIKSETSTFNSYKSVFDVHPCLLAWKPAARDNSECFYLKVGFGFVRELWTGIADGDKHQPELNLKHLELMVKVNF